MQDVIYQLLIKFLGFFLGSFGCFYLHAELSINIVLASASVGLVGSFVKVPRYKDNKNLQAVIYSGSFAGMCSSDFILSHWEFAVISITGALIFLSLKKKFLGLGGKLGMVAFLSVAFLHFFRGYL